MLQIHLLAKIGAITAEKGSTSASMFTNVLEHLGNLELSCSWATLPPRCRSCLPLGVGDAHPGPSLFLFKNKRSRFFKNCSRGVFVIINVILGNVTMLLKVHFRFVILGRCNMRRKPCGDVRQYSPTPPSQVWSPHYRQDLQTKNVQNGLLSQVFFGAWKLWRVLKKTATVPGLY